jgi:hypothetical protein
MGQRAAKWTSGGELQTIVFNGKDCRVVYQNRASRVFFHNRSSVGVRAIGIRAGDWSIEAMRDRVWRGESFSIIDKTIPLRRRPIIVNWSFAPIYDRRDRVTGFISEGFSWLPADESDIIGRLAAWLESAPPSDGRSTVSFPLASSPESLADSRKQLARSLRLALPPARS